jgi:predicted CoA-binding protein
MLRRGLSVVPVHAQVAEVEGQACVPSLGALPQPVEAVVLCVPPVHVPPLLHEAVAAGIPRVWLQQGCATAESVRLGHELGLEIVAGQCLLMHLEPVSGAHAFHRWLWRVLGKLPRDS